MAAAATTTTAVLQDFHGRTRTGSDGAGPARQSADPQSSERPAGAARSHRPATGSRAASRGCREGVEGAERERQSRRVDGGGLSWVAGENGESELW